MAEARSPRWRSAFVPAGLGVVAVVVVAAIFTGGDGSDDPPSSGSTTTVARAGPCADLPPDAIETALGGASAVAVVDARHCTVTLQRAPVSVEVEQIDADADADDLAALERRSGPDADHLEPWPEVDSPALGDQAVWRADPTAEGSHGELDVLVGSRLVRFTASTPPGYRRDARTIASALAEVALRDL